MCKALIVLSGGQDSTTCLFHAKNQGYELHAVSFTYGQRHVREMESANIVAQRAGVVSHEFISLGDTVLESTSPLVSYSELEQYKDHASLPGGIEKTFVPMRNMLFLTVAANRAVARGCDSIWTGVAQEDYGGYPDCRRDFIDSMEDTIELSNGEAYRSIMIVTPLMHLTKAQTVDLALDLPGCYEALAFSHTSYDGQYPPLGRDHATLLRAKGFEEAGVPDPLILRAYLEGKMALPDTLNYHTDELPSFLKRVADAMAEEHEIDTGIQVLGLEDPAAVHRAIGEALGEL